MKRENQLPLLKVPFVLHYLSLQGWDTLLPWSLLIPQTPQERDPNVNKQVIDNAVKDEETNHLLNYLVLGYSVKHTLHGKHSAQFLLQNSMSKLTFHIIVKKVMVAVT